MNKIKAEGKHVDVKFIIDVTQFLSIQEAEDYHGKENLLAFINSQMSQNCKKAVWVGINNAEKNDHPVLAQADMQKLAANYRFGGSGSRSSVNWAERFTDADPVERGKIFSKLSLKVYKMLSKTLKGDVKKAFEALDAQ